MGNHLKGFRHFTTMEIPEYFQNKNFSPSIQELPTKKLSIVVVIPSFNEADLKDSLMALASCSKPRGDVEVIVVVNHPENSSAEVVTTSEQSLQVVAEADSCWGSSSFRFYAIKSFNLPQKQAGVGLVRQIGMDEAAYRLFLTKQPGGIIACFDADATCEVNYLVELENFWAANPDIHACSIRFEHPIQGNTFPQEVYDGIAQYELHLRYYNQALRYTGFPFAFHTVGSSMACTAEAYVKFGGMNRHQAGEDFYFLQKIIPHGHFAELNTTCIYPSPRASNRVPFGTGKSMAMFLENPGNEIQTYQLESFFPLQMLFGKMQSLYQLDVGQIDCFIDSMPAPLKLFLKQNNATEKIYSISRNTASPGSFRKRFFLWFDAFLMLKYLNFVHNRFFKRQPVKHEAIRLAGIIGLRVDERWPVEKILVKYRELEANKFNVNP